MPPTLRLALWIKPVELNYRCELRVEIFLVNKGLRSHNYHYLKFTA
jgi:hypothetical protein